MDDHKKEFEEGKSAGYLTFPTKSGKKMEGEMTEREIIERKIELKEQLITITHWEIQALKQKLAEMRDAPRAEKTEKSR